MSPLPVPFHCLACRKGADFVYTHIQPQAECIKAADGGWAVDFIGCAWLANTLAGKMGRWPDAVLASTAPVPGIAQRLLWAATLCFSLRAPLLCRQLAAAGACSAREQRHPMLSTWHCCFCPCSRMEHIDQDLSLVLEQLDQRRPKGVAGVPPVGDMSGKRAAGGRRLCLLCH